ncbi:MAG: ACP S-malonyltransferase [Lachnospiraceae bacterium]|nr:ACP S-malonyltransferase [Lachnospiraceae bacterium]
MKIGFIYAGQGSQRVGMGKDFYDSYETFKNTLDGVSLDFDVKKCCFEGPEEQLNQTRYTQPCMVAFAVGVTKLLAEHGIVPEMACGLSLGEYSALCAAGVFTPEQVVPIVAYRGQVMEEAAKGRVPKMAAVLNAPREQIREACEQAHARLLEDTYNVVEAVNYNCPGQIVISGDEKAVDLASEILKEGGVKRVLPVKVSGPFHTSLMKPAGDALAERFQKEHFGEMAFPVIFNATAKPLEEGQTIAGMLERQVQNSVYFEDSVLYMKEQGIDTLIEVGPGKALSKFVKRIDAEMTCYSIDTVEDFKAVVEACGQA